VDAALVLYQELLRNKPDASFLYVEVGDMLAKAGRFSDALPYFIAATNKDPLSFDALLGQAVARDALAHNVEARDLYVRALLVRPGDRRARFNLGRVQYERGELGDAEATYQDLLARHPGDWKAHNNLGLVLLKRGQPTSAMFEFRRGLKHKPDDPGLLYNLGRAHAARKQHKRALTYFEQAIAGWGAKDLAAGGLHFAKGDSLFALERYADACLAYEKAVELDPDFTDAWLNLGAARANAGDASGAIEALEKALDHSPKQAEIHRMIALCYIEDDNLDAALTSLHRAAKLDGGSPETSSLITQVQRDKARAKEKQRALKKACELGDKAACDATKKAPPM
jgi:tetratricopeptide (TPR) repeat protein